MKTMYPAMVNSPEAATRGAVSASATEFEVSDGGIFSSIPLPYPVTLGKGITCETVLLKNVSGDTLTVERGFQGTPRGFDAGTVVSRNFTAWDHDAFVSNVLELKEGLDCLAEESLESAGKLAEIEEMLLKPPSAKKTAVFVIGHATDGHSIADVNYLCNGENDQTVINAAVGALPSSGGRIILLEGTYKLTGRVNVNKSGVTLEGAGTATVLERNYADTGAAGMVNVTQSGNTIKNICLSGNGSDETGVISCGVFLMSGTGHTVERCIFKNCITGIGIYYLAGNSNVSNNTVTNCGTGISLVNTGGSVISGNTVRGCREGFNIYETFSRKANTLSGNVAEECVYGFFLSAGCHTVISGNTASENDYNLYLDYGSHNNVITGNNFNQFEICAVYASGCKGNLISDNSCIRGTGEASDYSSSQHTMRFAGSPNSYNFITNNFILGKNLSDVAGGTGNTFYNNKYN